MGRPAGSGAGTAIPVRGRRILSARDRRLPALLAGVGSCLGVIGCAHHTGHQATSGALHSFAEEVGSEDEAGDRPIKVITGRAVDAAFEHLGSPENLAQLRVVMAMAAREAGASMTAAVTKRLIADLGPDGRGPLAASLTTTIENAAGAATAGAFSRLLACRADDAACLDRRVGELSRRSASFFVRGLKDELGPLPLLLAFLAGVVATVAAILTVDLLRGRRSTAAGHAAPVRREQPT
jgi:hypothetical protein